MMYVKAKRATLAAKHPELKFGDLGRLLGKKWNKLTDSEKAEWSEKGRKEGPKTPKKEKKRSPTKKSKKEKDSSSESDDESSSSSDEEEALSDAIQKQIKAIVASGVETLTIRQIKEQLKPDFAGEVEKKGAEIKAFVHKCVGSQ